MKHNMWTLNMDPNKLKTPTFFKQLNEINMD